MLQDIYTSSTLTAAAIRLAIVAGGFFSLILGWQVASVTVAWVRAHLPLVLIGTAIAGGVSEILRPAILDWIDRSNAVQYDGPTNLSDNERAAAFERVLQKKVSPLEFNIIQAYTDTIARAIGVAPADIYAVAASECGLDPFCVRKDGVAAGWIQFTNAGCVFVPGLTLSQVKTACYRRDAVAMMQWTKTYLVNTRKGRTLQDATDVYLCVFAPAFVGADRNTVLYQGKNNPAYYLNSGIDGWRVVNNKIVHQRKYKDYRITIEELDLMLKAKAKRITND